MRGETEGGCFYASTEKFFSKFVKKIRTVLWRLAISGLASVFWRQGYGEMAF
jgi:hypothetical protein